MGVKAHMQLYIIAMIALFFYLIWIIFFMVTMSPRARKPSRVVRASDGQFKSAHGLVKKKPRPIKLYDQTQLALALYKRYKLNPAPSFEKLASDYSVPETTIKRWNSRLVASSQFDSLKIKPVKSNLLRWVEEFSHGTSSQKSTLTVEQEQHSLIWFCVEHLSSKWRFKPNQSVYCDDFE